MKSLIAIAGSVALAIMAVAGPAFAHAFPDFSQPVASSIVSGALPEVRVHFDGAIDPAKSSVRVLDAGGNDMAASNSAVRADNRAISVPLKPLAPGQYFVKWSAYSADGAHTMGAFSFTFAPGAHR